MKKISKSLLLDTHIWLWYVFGDNKLKKIERDAIDSARSESKAYISAFSVWELSLHVKRERIILNIAVDTWVSQSTTDLGFIFIPVSPEIAIESNFLPGKFHSDPADRLITATARTEQLTLITRDEKIQVYGNEGFVHLF
jgi:PIN domain nuclease of toxin-antitoxin system